ncbi:MAG: type I methionyl aminopeptidase [Candidatus Niyogibacteria bacterium]|nr:type I methionyl aminopeptidase [Candidatus Niyogibacteria bacterium]
MTIKTEKDIEILREGGKKLARVMKHVLSFIAPGISAEELDRIAEEKIKQESAQASFKGYEGYPSSICVSVNDEIVHGIPYKEKILQEGDLIAVDIGLIYNGLFTDMARTVIVGKGDIDARRLLTVTEKALARGIGAVKHGAFVGDIGRAVESYVHPYGFGIVRKLVGHGVGYGVHEEPQIPNFVSSDTKDAKLLAGMVIAIEPMITEKGEDIITDADTWTVRTKDGSRAAHFEDTVLVKKNGAEILTRI